MNEWLEEALSRLAQSLEASPAEYELVAEEVTQLLEVARIAAHSSGDRTQAPLATYLVGLAHGRHPDHSLATLASVFTGQARETS